jgi:hypothetical protein
MACFSNSRELCVCVFIRHRLLYEPPQVEQLPADDPNPMRAKYGHVFEILLILVTDSHVMVHV